MVWSWCSALLNLISLPMTDQDYNAINTTIYYFSKPGKGFTSFSVWVSGTGAIVKAPDKYAQLLGMAIDEAIAHYQTKGFSCEAIL